MNFKQAVRMEKVEPSGTREVFSKCAKLMEQNIPFTSLTLGEPDFPTPKYIVDACKEAIDAGKTHYVAENGIPELRKAICEKLEKENGLHYTPDEISVTTGVAMAMFVAIVATLNPGDEILVPNPVYVTYWQIPQIAQAKIVTYDLLEENDYQVDVEQIRAKITDKTKMLVTVSPSNPTGGVLRHESLVAMADIAKEHDLIVLSDEIYDHFVYDESLKLESIASLPGMKERTIVLNGFSKSMAMTGWRLGYIAAPANFLDAMNRLSFYMTAGTTTFVQHAGVAARRRRLHCSHEDRVQEAPRLSGGRNRKNEELQLQKAGGRLLHLPEHQENRHDFPGFLQFCTGKGSSGHGARSCIRPWR